MFRGGRDEVPQTGGDFAVARPEQRGVALEPGQPISQVRLAAALSVSRTPLREALPMLENEGLVESDFNPSRGATGESS